VLSAAGAGSLPAARDAGQHMTLVSRQHLASPGMRRLFS